MTARDVSARGGRAVLRVSRWTGRWVRGEVVKRTGGPARARVITLFGAVLALNGADNATVGAVAPQLERALHIGNTKIGLLSSVALLVGAVFTIPVGMLVDRIKRVPMLSLSILLWSIASLLSAFAGSYSSLLLTRLLLGAVTATAGPAIASLTGDAVRRLGVEPAPELLLTRDPRSMGIVDAVRYILSIPTNILMIISSSLGYFYFSGLSTFALLFVRGHYGASQPTAELVLALLVAGALIGTLVSGRVTDQLLRRGMIEVRVWIPALCYLGAAALLVPGILGSHLTPAVWFDVAGASLLSAANPPLDAARLDIMPAGLWGRAESVRTFLRSLAQALAPLVFGGLSQLIAGIVPAPAPIGTPASGVSPSAARGLEISFLILLSTLVAAGVFLARARFTYAQDVATAGASNQGRSGDGPPLSAQAAEHRE